MNESQETVNVGRTGTDEITAVCLNCDGDSCEVQTPFYETAEIARSEAKKMFWTSEKVQKMSGTVVCDYCPKCSKGDTTNG
jgi:hypothetical protein